MSSILGEKGFTIHSYIFFLTFLPSRVKLQTEMTNEKFTSRYHLLSDHQVVMWVPGPLISLSYSQIFPESHISSCSHLLMGEYSLSVKVKTCKTEAKHMLQGILLGESCLKCPRCCSAHPSINHID